MNSSSYHSDASGFTAGLLLGLIIGGAGGYLLSTEKGQELLANLKEGAGDKLKEITENPRFADKLADLEETMTRARASVNQAATKVAESTVKEAPKKKNFFQRAGSKLGK